MSFRFQGKRAFLTYAGIGYEGREGYTKEELYAYLDGKFQLATQLIVGWEYHENGEPHAHVFIEWCNRQDFRNARDQFKFKNHVPNIQTVRSMKAVMSYVTKGGDYKAKVELELLGGQEVPVYQIVMTSMTEGATAEEAAKKAIIESQGKALRYYTQVLAFARSLSKGTTVCEPLRQYPQEFNINERTKQLLDHFIELFATRDIRNRDGKSLWLYGPSRLGKTQLARSLGRHWYMQGMWNIDQYSDEAEYGVIDDFDWEQFAKYGYKSMLGLQYQATVTDKYRGKRMILHGKPVIMITNELPEFKNGEGDWLIANVDFIEITDKCF